MLKESRNTSKLFCYAMIMMMGFALHTPLLSETFGPNSDELNDLSYLFARAKLVLPQSSYPAHASDLLQLLRDLPLPSSDSDVYLYTKLQERFSKNLGTQSAKVETIFAYEQRFRSKELLSDDSELKNGLDFQRNYLSLSPFFILNLDVENYEGFSLGMSGNFRPLWANEYFRTSNIPDSLDFAYNLVERGILDWNSPGTDMYIGRSPVHFGEASGSSLYPSKNIPFLDAIKIRVPIGAFSFDYLVSSVQPIKAKSPSPDVNPNQAALLDPSSKLLGEPYGFWNEPNPTLIVTAVHRFQWNFGPVKAGVGGTIIYARQNNLISMTDVLPVIVWHNSNVKPNNLCLVLDATWAVLPGLTLSGQLGFDDINLASTLNVGDSATPTIPAAIATLSYGKLLDKLQLSLLSEFGYTHYLWGNFGYSPAELIGVDPLERMIYRYTADHGAVLLPLTSPYGPGAMWASFSALCRDRERKLRYGFSFLALSRNKSANLVTTLYTGDSAVKNADRSYTFAFDFPVSWDTKSIKVFTSPSIILVDGSGSFSLSLGASSLWVPTRFFKLE
ncbi:hypothetical protein MASR2M78_02210 [Treponema sp.]